MTAALAGARRGYALGQNHEINVTPFVDVMLVLLIVLMVAAPLATTAIRMDLPPSGPGFHPRLEPPTIVSLATDGRLTIITPSGPGFATRPATLDSLSATLAGVLGARGSGGRRVFVRADPHVRYGRFVAVVDRLQTAGFYNLSLVDETPA